MNDALGDGLVKGAVGDPGELDGPGLVSLGDRGTELRTWVRNSDLMALLRWRAFSLVLTRFFWDLMFATWACLTSLDYSVCGCVVMTRRSRLAEPRGRRKISAPPARSRRARAQRPTREKMTRPAPGP